MFGIKHLRTIPYHPQANGLIERWRRVLKASLKWHGVNTNWSDVLPIIMLGLRTAVKDLGVSLAEMVYGQAIRLPGEFIIDEESNHITEN